MERSIRSLFSVDRDLDLDIEIDEIEGIIGASLFGAFQANVILHIADLETVKMLGATVNEPTLIGGAVMLFIFGILLGFPFLAFVSGSVNSFVTKIIMLSSKSTVLQKLLVPLLNISALGVTLFALGQIYGLVVGVVFFGFGVPLWLAVSGFGSYTIPSLGLVSMFAWLTYGGMMGLVHGIIMER